MLRSILLGVFVMVCRSLFSQSDCDEVRYRFNSAFSDWQVTYDIPYGNAINSSGLSQSLVVDVYEPVGDSETSRPLIILAHGGFFIGGSNDNSDVTSLCQDLARMGYVVGSISYRLGIDNFFDVANSIIRSVWRGYHDGKASVRYFRKSAAEDGNPFRIDPNRIIMGGVSAGAFIALHMAYVDEEFEIPDQVDQSAPGLGGGLEGLSGNPGYSSEVLGIINIAGALKTTDYISEGNLQLVSVHGTADETVPYEEGLISLSGFPITEVDGSASIHEVADSFGMNHCLTTLEGAGHVAHAYDSDAYYATLSTVSGFASSWVCDSYEPICGTYDYTSNIHDSFASGMDTFQIYPNPSASGETVLVRAPLRSSQEWSWEIWDVKGRLLSSGAASGSSATLTGVTLTPGFYVFRIPEIGKSRRLVIQ
jgi:poly(3-hydroxybutyrate) depolymerase